MSDHNVSNRLEEQIQASGVTEDLLNDQIPLERLQAAQEETDQQNPPTAPNINSEEIPSASSTTKQKHGLNKELCNLQSLNIPGITELYTLNSSRRRRPSYQQLLPMFQDTW